MAKANLAILLTILSSFTSTNAFVTPSAQRISTQLFEVDPSKVQGTAVAKAAEAGDDEPAMNPDNPNLPPLKGDYDWDAEYAADDDWITENVPGKLVVNEIDLAAQVTELTKIEEKYRKIRKEKEYEEARIIGFVPMAETYNSRFAMFFLTVGLLTEYWTGITIPGQIEEMARVGGFIGPDF